MQKPQMMDYKMFESKFIYHQIPTWSQDTYQETWKDLDKII